MDMDIKSHYIVTLCALFFLGVIVLKPGVMNPTSQRDERTCKLNKGRMECFYKYSEYKINKNSDVQYRLD